MRPARYFAAMGGAAILAFLVLWAWIAAMPMAYLDPEYPYWVAKQRHLADCDLGALAVLGDSRAAAGILPALLPMPATNLAVGGGKPIEALVALRRMLACPAPPRQVVLSFDIGHFMTPDLFWERSVKFGFVRRADLAELARLSGETGDWSVHEARQTDGLPPALRAALYGVRFPPLYFGSLAKGGGFLRWWRNQAALRDGLAARGQYFFGRADGSSAVAMDGGIAQFVPSRILDRYFDTLLGELDRHGIAAMFVAMPVNQATGQAIRPAVVDAFRAYLAGYQARYRRFHVVGPLIPAWPDRWFGDAFSHLNPAGAERFSHWLAACLRDGGAACPGLAEMAPMRLLSSVD